MPWGYCKMPWKNSVLTFRIALELLVRITLRESGEERVHYLHYIKNEVSCYVFP